MTCLTQVFLEFDTAARLRLRDNYDWHQAVWKAFPGRDGDKRNFLTRLDQHRGGFRLLIVSQTAPTRPDWCPPGEENWKTKPVPVSYFSCRRYAFQLCANPTKKIAKTLLDGSLSKNGRRAPLRTRDELVAWIKRKGEQGGFEVDEQALRTFPRGRDYFERKGVRGLHSAVEYQGVLSITDPARFQEAFKCGIGSAKAFGFGLLAIAPLR